ncbi:regulator of G-protein signaling loco isoform X2 [Venturia canescens]|uniref:regulator of G-protein signaling loco isoform X2 n=1 Tax=Venturia canescens TaxID=32260 RepID=UPI001C9C3A65|nr:regulator of G-protein signaling loco isoform X2 [Venturia canescens]
MHHNRRKKKRVNYGVRAVELVRGAKGFGFTISGQQPCILSCIVQGSPAESAGLRAGDYLVAVNGHNVGKAPHDDVVRLIGHSKGILRLQIAENYYSDSSDEEGLATVRSKPKYSHKPRNSAGSAPQLQCRVAKVVRDLQSGAMFDTSFEHVARAIPQSKIQCSHAGLHHRWNMASALPPPPPPLSHKRDSEKIVHRTVVGYLGTIDIPNQLHPSTMIQVLRKCIKRLKAEKRNPTTVLLTIHVANIKLTNSENRVIAEYPSYRIIFCNSFSDQDKQYFGILTKSVKDNDDIVSNSCHVFTIYYKLIDHAVHASTCNIFGFTCTKTSELNVCQEFPDSCNSLIGAIQTLYITDSVDNDANPYNEAHRHQETASPQPSNISTSTAHSSNSDSGIGFKDDYVSHSERKILPDFPQRRQCPSNLLSRNPRMPVCRGNACSASGSKLTVRALSDSRWSEAPLSRSSKDPEYSNLRATMESARENGTKSWSNEDVACAGVGPFNNVTRRSLRGQSSVRGSSDGGGDIITCPGPSARSVGEQTATSSVDEFASVCPSVETFRTETSIVESRDNYSENSHHRIAMEDSEHGRETSASSDNKLSPKVYNHFSKSLVHSMEDLKPTKAEFSSSFGNSYTNKNEPRPWGSLQEMRNVGGCDSDSCLHGSSESFDKTSNGNGVHTWASGFEKLLEDPKGLQTFAEFLKKEFSHENIYFWAACERYKDTADVNIRRRLACQIYQRHLSTTAAEPVNVDSHASGQITQELLNQAPADLFLQAQKQVFNLMKFDSYPRFLRSDLYRHCLETGSGVVSTEDCDLTLTSSPSIKLKKSHSDAEDRCRKSILPWHRKNRSKSKDRGESEYNKTPSRGETIYKSFTTMKREAEGNNNEDSISISSSRSSLASWDLALRQSFNKHLVNLKYPSAVLAGQEVEVVPTKVLKVDLPSRRVITVIGHKGRTLREVLRPRLNKYGFKLDLITIWGEGHPVSLDIPATNAPARLVLTSNSEDFHRDGLKYPEEIPQGQPTLDEITNKVFEELLVGKSTNKYHYSEGSCKSDDQRSEGSSILPSKFFLRDSTIHGKKKSKSKCSNASEKSNSTDCTGEESSRPHPPLIAKWRNGVKLQLPGRFEGDELYEGIKRAQRSRLEDQRGTEINFELPDFLKNKENGKHPEGKKMRRGRLAAPCNEGSSKFYDTTAEKSHPMVTPPRLSNGFVQCENEVNYGSSDPPNKVFDTSLNLDGTLIDGDQTIIENCSRSQNKLTESQSPESQYVTITPTKLSKPPPLPPKPKSLMTSAAKANHILSAKSYPRIVQNSASPPTESRDNKHIF